MKNFSYILAHAGGACQYRSTASGGRFFPRCRGRFSSFYTKALRLRYKSHTLYRRAERLIVDYSVKCILNAVLGDRVDHIHTRDNVAEGGVISVKVRRVRVADEELRRCRIGIVRSCHRNSSALVNEGIFVSVCGELALDGSDLGSSRA